jgi:hypothetical protein
MFANYVTITAKSVGVYEVTNPDGKKALYTYTNGNLTSVEIDTPVGTVTTKNIALF